MQRQIAKIVRLLAECTYDHFLHRNVAVPYDAVAIPEPAGRIEVLVVFESLVGESEAGYAVQSQQEEQRVELILIQFLHCHLVPMASFSTESAK